MRSLAARKLVTRLDTGAYRLACTKAAGVRAD